MCRAGGENKKESVTSSFLHWRSELRGNWVEWRDPNSVTVYKAASKVWTAEKIHNILTTHVIRPSHCSYILNLPAECVCVRPVPWSVSSSGQSLPGSGLGATGSVPSTRSSPPSWSRRCPY